MKNLILLLTFAGTLAAQNPPLRTVTLTWEDTRNPAGTTYNVYRAVGACSPTSVFGSPITQGVVEKTWLDNTVVEPGVYCYQVTAAYNGHESEPSPQAQATAKPVPPAKLTVTVTIQYQQESQLK